ncbi:MAG TPA: DUF4157 domain-containing protein [Pyrinomonadaceae bacterium]
MWAAIARDINEIAAAKKQAAKPPPEIVSHVPAHPSHTGLTLQRKAACACGGSCPRCAEESEHAVLQTKLRIGTPGDEYEREADRVADAVTSLPELHTATVETLSAHASSATHSDGSVARRYTPCGVGDEVARVDLVPGGGEPLAPSAKALFEPRFGHDFGNVRVHTDPRAADSARRMNALAYTFGRDIVFGAGMYEPGTPWGRKLLAHELAHVVQQSGGGAATGAVNRPAPLHVQRQATDPDLSGPCSDDRSENIIEPAFTEARRWRRLTAAWLEAHLDHIRARGALARDGYVRIGRRVFDELMLLQRHFRISDVLRVSLPYTADDLVSVPDLQRYGNASYWVRRRFDEVELTLSYLCQTNCPRGRTGSDLLGSAVAGMKEVIFYTNCFDGQHETTRAGTALHEAFHAGFSEFNHDTYYFEGGYPGDDPLTNAESFATFAAFVATGSNYRITNVPGITIHGNQ